MKNNSFHLKILSLFYLIFLLIIFYLPLNIIDADQDWIDGIGFIVVWCVLYIRRLKEEDFYANVLRNNVFKDWVSLLAVVSIPLIVWISSGVEMIWHGIAWGICSALGVVLQNWVVKNYIRKYVVSGAPGNPINTTERR